MVGNAEPGKEYNYRPLSKLCECQLDVNDQVSTKGPGREGSERERELNSNGEQERDRQTEGERDKRSPSSDLLGAETWCSWGLGSFSSARSRASLECAQVWQLNAFISLPKHFLSTHLGQ